MAVGRLLERDASLETLGRQLAEAEAGRGHLVLLGAEAGGGKTTLVQHFCQRVGRSARVFLGACDALSTPRPLGPLIDIAGGVGGPLAQMLREARPRPEVFGAFLDELAGLAGPAVIVFEDLHWADEATVDLLRFLGRRLGATRTLLIATYRDDELGPTHPLRIMMGDLATTYVVRRLSLPPLSEEAVELLASGSGLDPIALHRLTGGNPFFLTEVLASGGQGVPPTVRDAVLARVARLSPAARLTLEAAAIVGSRIEPAILAEVVGPEAEAVEECFGVGILRSDGDRLAFRHELAREAVLTTLSPQRSATWHARVLERLRARTPGPDDLARLAHHAEAAADREAVLEYAPAAARRAVELRAHREAAAQYARALRFADGLPPEDRARLLKARAYECYLTEQMAEAIEAQRSSLEIWRGVGNRLEEGDSLRWLSRFNWFAGRNAEAEQAAEAGLKILEALPPGRELALAYSTLSQFRMLSQDNDLAVDWGEKAIALAERLGDVETLSHALNNVGSALLGFSDDRGRLELERSLALALEAGLDEHAARAFANLAVRMVRSYRLPEADRYFELGLAYCIARDLDAWRMYMLGWRALSLLHRGRWPEAIDVANAALGHPSLSPVSRTMPLVVLGRARARQGDPLAAAAVLDEALALVEGMGELQRVGPVRIARAEAAWWAGDRERVAEEAGAAYDMAISRRDEWLVGEMAYWLRRVGALSAPPAELAEPFALQIECQWLRAAECWQALDCPYEAAQALADGDDPAALQGALATFEQLGAAPAAALVERRLRHLGVRDGPRIARLPSPTGQQPTEPLTRREREVAALIARGLSNRQIAEALVITPGTAGIHVGNILRKLELHSRAQIAAWWSLRSGEG